MKENPYSKIIEIIKEKGSSNNPPGIRVGKVVSPPPNLAIKIDELQIDKDNILIADYLLKKDDYVRQYETSFDKIIWGETKYIRHTDTLKAGELLAVMPVEDRQLYIILARLKEVG